MSRGFELAVSEAAFQSQVEDYALLQGWEFLHLERSTNERGYWRTPVRGKLGKGWPDLFLVRGPRAVAAELKADKGKVSEEQRMILALLAKAGIETYIWRPRDFHEVMVRLGDNEQAG